MCLLVDPKRWEIRTYQGVVTGHVLHAFYLVVSSCTFTQNMELNSPANIGRWKEYAVPTEFRHRQTPKPKRPSTLAGLEKRQHQLQIEQVGVPDLMSAYNLLL